MASKVSRHKEWPELVRLTLLCVITSQSIPLVVENQLETLGINFFETWLLNIRLFINLITQGLAELLLRTKMTFEKSVFYRIQMVPDRQRLMVLPIPNHWISPSLTHWFWKGTWKISMVSCGGNFRILETSFLELANSVKMPNNRTVQLELTSDHSSFLWNVAGISISISRKKADNFPEDMAKCTLRGHPYHTVWNCIFGIRIGYIKCIKEWFWIETSAGTAKINGSKYVMLCFLQMVVIRSRKTEQIQFCSW